jgi:hypothetical protein
MRADITINDRIAAARGAEAARLVPENTVWATIDWPLPPDDCEETILPGVVTALSQALAKCGSVAFRSNEPLDGAIIYHPAPPRSIKNRLLDLAGLGENLFGIIVATDPAVIAELFDEGWNYAMQAAIVFDPEADSLPIFNALRRGLDWRGQNLPDGARLLFGPGHDGVFAVIAASDPVWIVRFKRALE